MKKFLAALVIVGNLFFSSTADAEIKNYSATGAEVATEFEPAEVVKLRALYKAINLATEQAAADFKKVFGDKLSDDEIFAIIDNGCELGEVNYTQADSAWQATIQFKIDDAEVKNFFQRDDRERFTLINQTLEKKKIFAANDLRAEKLRKRAENIKKRDEKKFFKAEFEYVNNEFLSNRKVAEGNKFFYRGRIDDAISLYKEAIVLDEYSTAAFNRRGNLYNVLALNQTNIPIADSNRRMSLNDLDKAIRLDNNCAEAFSNRGFVYLSTKLFGQAVKDFNRAIQLEPNVAQNYVYRAQCTRQTDSSAALADFNKAIELAPKNSVVYAARGNFYEQDVKDFSKALEDYTRAIDFSRQENEAALNFNNRGDVYKKMNSFGKAIDDYTRAISLLESQTQKSLVLPWVYRKRGECYQAAGDAARAQADFKKFGELQRR